jgi:YesN/AraC family two-component response regulator
MTTVVIVDDHPIVRAGMRATLDTEADIRVMAEGEKGADALRLVNKHMTRMYRRWMSPCRI